jgi:hypothetical protein
VQADEPGLGAEIAGLASSSPTTTSASTPTSTSTTDHAQSKILAEIKQDVFGRKGDFITSPEISQVFGEVSPSPDLRAMNEEIRAGLLKSSLLIPLRLNPPWLFFVINNVHGEQLLALFLTTEWIAQGRPGRIRLVELGPGRGTLMDDVLRVSVCLS